MIVAASALADQGRFAEALAFLGRARTRDDVAEPYTLRLWYVRGDILAKAGRRDEAAEEFRKVMRHDAERRSTRPSGWLSWADAPAAGAVVGSPRVPTLAPVAGQARGVHRDRPDRVVAGQVDRPPLVRTAPNSPVEAGPGADRRVTDGLGSGRTSRRGDLAARVVDHIRVRSRRCDARARRSATARRRCEVHERRRSAPVDLDAVGGQHGQYLRRGAPMRAFHGEIQPWPPDGSAARSWTAT